MKKNNGITLISLVIAIIILIILAGIASYMILGEHGMLTKAQNNKTEMEISIYEQELELIGVHLRTDKIRNKWSSQKFMNEYEKEINTNLMFEEAETGQIRRDNTIVIQVVTKEGYVFEVTPNEAIQKDEKEDIVPLEITDIYVALNGNVLSFYKTETSARDNADSDAHYYGNIKDKDFSLLSYIPWYNDRTTIEKVVIVDEIIPKSTVNYFRDLVSLKHIENLENLNTSKVTNMTSMFHNCNNLLSLNLSSLYTNNVTSMSNMFSNCTSLSDLNLSNFDTINVVSMNNMFANCSSLTTLNLTTLNTSNVTNMSNMFNFCSKLETLNLSNFNTSNVTNMLKMFYHCSNLKTLNSSNFDTRKVTDMSNMFDFCSSLEKLDLSTFDTINVSNMSSMFYYCSKLKTLNLSNFDTTNVTNLNTMFYNVDSNIEIIINKKSENWLNMNFPNFNNVTVIL